MSVSMGRENTLTPTLSVRGRGEVDFRGLVMKFYELAGYFERIEETSGRIAMTELLAEIFKSVDPGEACRVAYLIQGRVAPRFVEVEFGIGNKLLQAAIASAFDVDPGEVRKQLRDLAGSRFDRRAFL